MAIWKEWELDVDVDAVIRGQGADPTAIRRRSKKLLETAEQALEEGLPLLRPQVLVESIRVEGLLHDRLRLENGGLLRGELISRHLAPASEVMVVVCSIGRELEEHTAQVMESEIVRGLALYGVGSAAVELLANTACQRIELEAAGRGLQTTVPLGPGMIGWPVEEGQRQVFDLLDASAIGVELTEANIMLPLKSLSMVIGLGVEFGLKGRTCDYCNMRDVCRFQDHYAPAV
jgi:hypothetical protein